MGSGKQCVCVQLIPLCGDCKKVEVTPRAEQLDIHRAITRKGNVTAMLVHILSPIPPIDLNQIDRKRIGLASCES